MTASFDVGDVSRRQHEPGALIKLIFTKGLQLLKTWAPLMAAFTLFAFLRSHATIESIEWGLAGCQNTSGGDTLWMDKILHYPTKLGMMIPL